MVTETTTLIDLELERDYDIRKFIKKHLDIIFPATIAYVLLMTYYENILAILVLPLGYIIINEKYKRVNARNLVKLDYIIAQNQYFQDVRENANKIMDALENEKAKTL